MSELWLWRGVSAVLLVAVIALGAYEVTRPARRPAGRMGDSVTDARPMGPRGGREGRAPREREVALEEGAAWTRPPPGRPASEAAPLSPEVMEVARQQIRAEDRARREARSEERYQQTLATIDTFADDNKLTATQRDAMSDAALALHERLGELREAREAADVEAPGSPEAGHRDRHEGFRAAFEQFDQEVRAAIGDDLADDFHETMHRDDRGDGPPGRPGSGGPPASGR